MNWLGYIGYAYALKPITLRPGARAIKQPK